MATLKSKSSMQLVFSFAGRCGRLATFAERRSSPRTPVSLLERVPRIHAALNAVNEAAAEGVSSSEKLTKVPAGTMCWEQHRRAGAPSSCRSGPNNPDTARRFVWRARRRRLLSSAGGLVPVTGGTLSVPAESGRGAPFSARLLISRS